MGTIINNYADNATVVISTHLIADIERVLDEVIFLKEGRIVRHETVDELKAQEGKSVDEVFREEFRMGSKMTGKLMKYEFRSVFKQIRVIWGRHCLLWRF